MSINDAILTAINASVPLGFGLVVSFIFFRQLDIDSQTGSMFCQMKLDEASFLPSNAIIIKESNSGLPNACLTSSAYSQNASKCSGVNSRANYFRVA